MLFARVTPRSDFAETMQMGQPAPRCESAPDALELLARAERADRALLLLVACVGCVTLLLAAVSAAA
jgi:hypothetical protein